MFRKYLQSQEIHQYFMRGNQLDIPSSITVYRAIHLLVELFNDAMNSQLFVLMLTCGITEVICAGLIINRSGSSNLPFFLRMFFIILFVQATVGILGWYGFSGDFNQISERSLCKIRRHENITHLEHITRRERKYKKKLLCSFQVQKIKFGLSNYIDKTTPAVFELFCLQRIIDLLLVR